MSTALWQPSEARIQAANISRLMAAVEAAEGQHFGGDYFALQDWSLAHPETFWSHVWDFCGVQAAERGHRVLADGGRFPGARWFPDARLNFAENLLRRRDDHTALVSLLENGQRRSVSYAQLYRKVAQVASSLRALGIQPGAGKLHA